MTTIVTPGESREARIERERDWTCPRCGCVFRPGPDDLIESQSQRLGGGWQTVEWVTLCPQPGCLNCVTSRWRDAFDEWGPGWKARWYMPAMEQEPAHWWHRAEYQRLVVVGFLLAVVALWALVMVLR